MDLNDLPLTRLQKSAQTRDSIIEAARLLLRQSGYDQLTVRNVCQLANVSNGTFYHFFQSKDDMMSAFLRWDHVPPFGEDGNDDLLEYIISVYLELLDRYAALGVDFAAQFFTPKNPSFNYRTRQGIYALDLYAQLLRDAQAQGFVTPARHIDEILCDLQAIVIGNIFEWAVFNGNFDVKGNLDRMLRTYLKNHVFTDAYFVAHPSKDVPNV